ncbi:MAG: lipase family protein, partial [Chloroflexota bacterium]
ASVFASYGYAVVVADYLGLGSSPGYQAYCHARSEATCVVDALRAGKSLCASNNVTLNAQLFLAGYSQGGHVTMAAHRELETFHTNEFTVTASAPCAGPYDLGGVTIESLLTRVSGLEGEKIVSHCKPSRRSRKSALHELSRSGWRRV